jgi:hypothetical protein
MFLLHRILLSAFIIVNMLGEIGNAHHEALVLEDKFTQEWIWTMIYTIYTISFLVFTAGLIWYNKISVSAKKNIQSTADKYFHYLE